jgi:membrane fusion protein, heavy metal efflux system
LSPNPYRISDLEIQVKKQIMDPSRLALMGLRGMLIMALTWTAACSSEPEESGAEEAGEEHQEGFVEMDSTAMANVGLQLTPVSVVTGASLSATGTIIYDQNRVAEVGPRAEGRVVSIETDLGRQVQAGVALAVLESPDLGEAEAAHEQARAELALARENYDRELALFEKGISSRREMVEARTVFVSKEAEFRSATARHRTLGAVDHPEDSIAVSGLYALSAPIAGTVVERDLVLGQLVGTENSLFTVADLTHLWIVLDIYDRDLSRVRAGMDVEILTTAFPDEKFEGTLTYLGQIVDPTTRTVKARVEIRNPERTLRPGMFATAVIHGLEAAGNLAVADEAVQEMGGRDIVFVSAESGRFEVRDVTVGPVLSGGLVTILDGLTVGEKVVARGSFYLKSELLKESFGGDGH